MCNLPRSLAHDVKSSGGICRCNGGMLRVCAFLCVSPPKLISSRLKGPDYESGTRMQVAAGLHHLMSNHFHVMVSQIVRALGEPLLTLKLGRDLGQAVRETTSAAPGELSHCGQCMSPRSTTALLGLTSLCSQERSNSYERALREKSRIIRQTEMGNMKQKGRSKKFRYQCPASPLTLHRSAILPRGSVCLAKAGRRPR